MAGKNTSGLGEGGSATGRKNKACGIHDHQQEQRDGFEIAEPTPALASAGGVGGERLGDFEKETPANGKAKESPERDWSMGGLDRGPPQEQRKLGLEEGEILAEQKVSDGFEIG